MSPALNAPLLNKKINSSTTPSFKIHYAPINKVSNAQGSMLISKNYSKIIIKEKIKALNFLKNRTSFNNSNVVAGHNTKVFEKSVTLLKNEIKDEILSNKMSKGIPQETMGIKKSNTDDVIQVKENLYFNSNSVSPTLEYVNKVNCVEYIKDSKSLFDDSLRLGKLDDVYTKLFSSSYTLLHNLKDFQIKQLETHILHQYEDLADHVKSRTHYVSSQENVQNSSHPSILNSGINTEKVKQMSTAALVKYIKNCSSESYPNSTLHQKAEVKLNNEELCDIYSISKEFFASLKKLTHWIDTDATESSSCDENSDDEILKGSRMKKNIRDSPEWKLAQARASIAYRWIWLQAQISNLDHQIRHQSNSLQELRKSKERLVFEGLPYGGPSLDNKLSPPSCDTSKDPANKPKTNGFFDFGKYHQSSTQSDSTPSSLPLSRTCPLKNYQKRKIYRVDELPQNNQSKVQATRLSTLACCCKCQEQPLVCINCNGRYNFTRSVDPDSMPFNERIAILDPSFHPVLSKDNEMDLSVQWEHLLKTNGLFKNIRPSVRKFRPYLSKSFSESSSSYKPNGFTKRFPKTQRHKLRRRGPRRRRYTIDQDDGAEMTFRHRRRTDSDFDIDNIVIPSNSGLHSKVEPYTPYKEIITPKWRISRLSDSPIKEEGEVEDTSDEAFAQRHQKCEANEKLRFVINRQGSGSLRAPSRRRAPAPAGDVSPFAAEDDPMASADWKCSAWLSSRALPDFPDIEDILKDPSFLNFDDSDVTEMDVT